MLARVSVGAEVPEWERAETIQSNECGRPGAQRGQKRQMEYRRAYRPEQAGTRSTQEGAIQARESRRA